MKMKQLHRYTTILLRTVLLLGGVLLWGTNIQAQTEEQRAEMPDAFETIEDVNTIINDGNYYYIQFYDGSDISYLSEHGDGNNVRSKDYIPYASNRLWTLVGAGGSSFYLKSARGIYVRLDGINYKGTNSQGNATSLTYLKRTDSEAGGGYEILVNGSSKSMEREGRAVWANIVDYDNNTNRYPGCRLRIARLKDNIAHVIYWQEPIYDTNHNVVDRNADTRGGSAGFTKRHYLTYSGTDGNQSDVSSRASVVWYYDAWTLPTAAAYHQDGLWTLESAGANGEFFIKRYGSENYLNHHPTSTTGSGVSALGTKNADYGKYLLESPTVNNRYVRIQNGNRFDTKTLADNMFFEWNGWGADATKTSDTPTHVDVYFGNNTQLSAGGTVYGDDWHVNYLKYADLTGYAKITFEGTQGLELRVLMNRVEPIPEGESGRDADGGALTERRCTIGADGKAEVDLSDLAYAHLNSIKVNSGSGTVSSVTLVKPKYNTISLSASQFYTWNGVDASATHSSENPAADIVINTNTNHYANQVIAGLSNASVYYTTYADLTGCSKIIIEGDPGMKPRVLLNRPEPVSGGDPNGGTAIERIVTIGANGKTEVDFSDLPYVHLNAIKLAGDSPNGTITSITLLTPSTDGNALYMSCANTDGNLVTQNPSSPSSDWYAGFLPVEVPEPNQDNFYQVQLVLNENSGLNIPAETRQAITFTGDNVGRTAGMGYDPNHSGYVRYNPSNEFQRCFQYTNLATNNFQKIIIRFYRPVKGSWHISGIVDGGQGWEKIPEGTTIYEMDLSGISTINDFCIFNWDANESNPLDIAEIYFYSGYTLGRDGCMTPNSIANPILWKLEQVNDYSHFHLQSSDGRYIKEVCSMTNNINDAETYTNLTLGEKFTVKWVYVEPVRKEIPVNYYVTHRESYLKEYAQYYSNQGFELDKQGLATGAQSEWWDYEKEMQKVNHFEITHYLKEGDTKVIEFPTVLNNSNDHIYYQRYYNYDEADTQMDLTNLKNHVSLDVSDYGDVQYFLYKNGMVTGQKLDWSSVNQGDFKRNVQRHFNFTNYSGQRFTVAVDVSRYSDLTYKNTSKHLEGNIEEPSLTMRYIYYMRDAKEMADSLTQCTYGGSKWLESKTFHFPSRQIAYESKKKVGYRGEFIGLRHVFSDYWVYNDPQLVNSTYLASLNLSQDALKSYLNDRLVSAVISNTEGRIEVSISDPNGTGIRLGGYNPNINLKGFDEGADGDYKGFYFYDRMSNNNKIQYGDSRFIVFRYPSNGRIADEKVDKPVYINVYLNAGGTKYQLAQFTVIFDKDTETLPWKKVKLSEGVYTNEVQNTPRDPNQLRTKAGKPIAKITFDYPYPVDNDNTTDEETTHTYHFPSLGTTRHNGGDHAANGIIRNSSPVPLTYDKTNYSFDGDNTNWGSYAMVAGKSTVYGKWQKAEPVNHATYGYNIDADPNYKSAFLYIDASEQPGDICSAPFIGNFCAGDKLMFSGWISGSNAAGETDNRCPGGVTLTVKGEHTVNGKLKTETLYRFCPGQCYELDDNEDAITGVSFDIAEADRDKYHVVWQQFYFEFTVSEKYDRHWIEVNNNCVSSQGGDFMLDNIEVYCIVPEIIPEMNTPLCVQRDGTAEMRLLKLKVDFNKLKSSTNVNENTTSNLGLVFLDKQVFLSKFKTELGYTKSLDELAQDIKDGKYDGLTEAQKTAYKKAFDAALVGKKAIWKSSDKDNTSSKGAGVLYYEWNSNFNSMPEYSFENAVTLPKNATTYATYRYTDPESNERFIVMNGNYPELPWMPNTDYYIVPSNTYITSLDDVYDAFDLCSECTKYSVFQVEPPYKILSMEAPDITDDYAFCEGKIPTLLVDLKGYTSAGEPTLLKNLNYDWWLGSDNTTATLENYHKETNDAGTVKLDDALYAFRNYYPSVTSVDGVKEQLSQQPYLTREMIYYLQELVNKGELVLHQKSISILAKKTSADYPYFYMVACPILDYDFYHAVDSVPSAYFCEAPQGLRMKVGEKAPSLKTGFVPDENGLFSAYHYPESNIVLSVRLAKKAQFETVKHGEKTEAPVEPSADNGPDADEENQLRYLWLPLRDAKVQSGESTKVIQKSDDYNIYLASTDDPTWDQAIYLAMNAVDNQNKPIGALPVVGKIVQLNAIDTSKEENNALTERNANRLCVYFTENFEVREGYNYTLSLPFKESPGTNTCDGTILMHLKIVPDYEVWTGGAGNTDWNNDQNWRRADGNMTVPSEESTDESALNNNELLVSDDLPDTSGLYDYTTNYQNYRTAKDRLLRKGYAPLYCTHILLKGNEWGDAPVLFDALNGKNALDASPFPNLSETYEVNTVEYSIDEKYTTIDAIGNNSFAIVNETDNTGSKMLYGTNAQNLGYGSYEAAMQYTNSGFYFKLVPAVNVTDENNNVIEGNLYYLWLQTPGGQNYTVFSEPGYLNSQPATGWCSFILGLNGRNGQDIKNGAVWKIEESDGKFALKNMGTGLYLKNAGPANNEEPTHFTFCKLQGETVSSSSNVRANVLKYDIQAREYSIWKDTYGEDPDKGRAGDLIAEMYQINSCDEIAFQPSAELLNAHLLNYNNAWMEYQLDMNRWYLLGSALQGTIAGEWYAPTGTAQQETTYYENVTFGEGYDRYSPAIYQRSWDKAKAVLYEIGSTYNTNDDSQTENLGSPLQGAWSGTTWSTTGADRYLDRLGYKPMDGNKANVAIQGVWSNTYNDATVDYTKGGFSVMVNNGLKNNDSSDGTSIIRLPKEDTMYDYYKYSETGADDGGTDTYLINRTEDEEEIPGVQTAKNRAKNRGRLKTDLLLPVLKNTQEEKIIQKTEKTVSRYGDQRTYTRIPIKEDSLIAMNAGTFSFSETIPAGQSHLGFYLVENPFPCGLNMNKFFDDEANPILVDHKKYWLLKVNDNGKQEQQLVQLAPDGTWIQQSSGAFEPADSIIAPGQGFFVQAPTTNETTAITFNFNKDMQAQSRYGVKRGASKSYTIVVGTKMVNNQPEEITNTVEINSYTQNGNKKYPLKAPTRAAKAEGGSPLGLVITALRDGYYSSALVMQREQASNDFLPAEDTETFLNSDLKQVPTVYTLCGRLATTINSIHDFSYLPLGVESASDVPCMLTFKNVEALGDSVAFYDAVEKKLTPLESGMQFSVSGQTQNRYYLVRSLSKEEAAAETHLQIFTEGLTAKVIASTAEPITSVRCYDTAGRLIHQATPQTSEYSFSLPRAGIYIIEAKTENDRKTKKVLTK